MNTEIAKKEKIKYPWGVPALILAGSLCAVGAAGAADIGSLAVTLGVLAVCAGLSLGLRGCRLAPLRALPAVVFAAVGAYMSAQLLYRGSFTWFAEGDSVLHLMGAAWVCALYLLLCAIGGARLSVALGGTIMLIFGIANYCLMLFRGRPLLAVDITSWRTALNVAGSYEFRATGMFVLAVVLAVSCAWCAYLLCPKKTPGGRITKIATRAVCLLLSCWYIGLCLGTDFMYRNGIFFLWDENEFEADSVMYFAVTAQKLNVEAPDGYCDEALNDIAAGIENTSETGETKPHVIVVMSEAFSDLSVLGEFETTQSVTPFVDSLRESTLHGYAASSVLGGNTANSEYEFLTGDTMAFIPPGTVPYQLYVNYEADTLVSTLKAQGYSATAMHPYLSSGWNRVRVYELFGFEDVLWKDDFEGRKFLRNYVTDECDYENLIRVFEEKSADGPAFIFNITVQNHGAYTFEDFSSDVQIVGHEGEFPQAEQYLSLLRETDSATRELIEYFGTVDEPVILLFFGDHQPKLETAFYDLIMGKDSTSLSLQENQSFYLTPFFIWANYPIETGDLGVTSLNYLSTVLLETADLRESDYFAFLSDLRQTLPAVNARGAMDCNGVWHSLYDESTAQTLAPYRILQYNRVFDPPGYRREIFAVE